MNSDIGELIRMIFTVDAVCFPLLVVWVRRRQIELSLFINELSNRLIAGDGCRRIAHLAWIGKTRSADRNL